MHVFLDMFLTFAKVGVMTFGGGYAMLPILEREVVQNKKWATEEELMNYFAVGQCTPGVIAVNTATFIGYKYRGIPGAIFARYHNYNRSISSKLRRYSLSGSCLYRNTRCGCRIDYKRCSQIF